MSMKWLFVLLIALLLFCLSVPALATCEGDPPGNPSCYKCEDGVWVLESWADCGQDSDCTGECHNGCSNCSCVDDQSKCTGECHTCSGGSCIDDDTKCDDCYSCVDGSCDWDCATGQCCSDDDCVDDCPSGECCDDGECVSVCPYCNDCVSGTCQPIEVASVISDKGGACVNCSITFTATTDPSGHEDEVSWSGGGDPSTGSGPTFTTSWGAIGKKTVTASLCDSSKSKDVYVAEPTNFRLEEWWDLGGGDLMMYYEWDSTSGALEHLQDCELSEKVIYPNGDPFVPPDPPFDSWSVKNPSPPSWGPATQGWFFDKHQKSGGFSKPYCNASFTGSQRYRYRDCTGSPIIDLTGTISIIREVFESSGYWWYSTTKDPAYAEGLLPP